MKKILTYLVFYSYGMLIFKPVWPVLYDKMSHLCWEYEHLQVVHQHNGIYHVDQELRDETDKSQKENNNGIYKFQGSEFPHIISEPANEFLISVIITKNYPPSSVYPAHAHHETDYPPPRA